jgi:tripartite-type tricarboxylate transporter receptor subunit TctC
MSMRNVSPAVRKHIKHTRRDVILGGAAFALCVRDGLAQDAFPSRPVTLIVPGLPGGGFDPIARAISEHAARSFGQPVVLEHKPGGTMTIGPATMVANARTDGHTVSMIVSTIVRIPLMQKVPFDPLADLTHIIQLCELTVGVVTRADMPFSSVADVVEFAKNNPRKLTYGTPGIGSGAHFGFEQFARKAGITMTHVPFRGAPEGIAALLGGHIQLYVSASEWKPQVAAGQFRLLGVFSETRRASWPDTPTFTELGFPTGLGAATFGIAGPKGMPPGTVVRLHDTFKAALDDPKTREILARHELVLSYRSGADYRRYLEETALVDKEMVVALGLQRKD